MNNELKFDSLDKSINRALETRRDNDTFKTPSIEIYDVDYAIYHYLNNVIDLQVEDNGRMVNVPVVFSSAEMWSQIQSTNMVLSPKDRREFENIRDLHSQTTNSDPSVTYYVSVIPEFYKVDYDLIMYTSQTVQMNKLVQSIMVTSNFVWGDNYKFRTLVGDFSFETMNPSQEERVVKATTTLTVDARLQQEFELRKSTIQKAHSIKRVVFKTERSSWDIRTVDQIPGKL